MAADILLRGSKGGGASFKQTPDNLRSNDTFEGVLAIGIGPMKGPKRGLKSIKLDGTAIENETGQLNFGDFVANIGNGDPAAFPQKIQLKLGVGGAPTQVGVALSNPATSPGTPGPWVTRTLNNTNAGFIDLRFIVSQLFRQDKKGIYNNTATLEIQMKPVGSGTWINPTTGTPQASYSEQGLAIGNTKTLVPRSYFDAQGAWLGGSPNYGITGKTTSPAVYELRIAVPNEGNYADTAWDVSIRLLEPESVDNDPNFEKRSISWESMAAVYGKELGTHEDWRGVAWLQLYGKASDQLTGVPEVTGEWETKIVSVPPSNIFDPETRQYTSAIWDGSWTKAYTNDPAWIINDAISDSLSGLSLIAPGSYLNKWDALELSKWCSQPVPDGKGGFHPRYSINIAVSDPQKAEDFVRYLAGAVGGLAWDQGNGEWRVKVDKPDTPVDIFTLETVEGEFVYAGTDIDTRYNDIIGQFKNAEMDYRQDAVRLFDNVSIAKIGRKPTTVALVGCTNRQEALRRIKLRIRSTVNETRIVNFVTNRRGRNINPLEMILISDGDMGEAEKRTHGRTVAISADRKTIVLRDPVYMAPAIEYNLRFAAINPAYNPESLTQPTNPDWSKPTKVLSVAVSNTLEQRGSTRTIYLSEPLPENVADNLAVALEAPNLPAVPKLYRVTSVAPQDDGERIAISAIEVDTGKWDAADNVSNQDTVFQDLTGPVPPPTKVPGRPLLSVVRVPIEQGFQINLQANWVRPAGAYINGFRIQYSVNGGALQTAVSGQQIGTTWELPNAGPGVYHVEVSTIDRRGGFSPPLVEEIEVTQGIIDAGSIPYGDGSTVGDLKPDEAGAQKSRSLTLSSTGQAFTLLKDGSLLAGQVPYYIRSSLLQSSVDVTQQASYAIEVTGGVSATVNDTAGSPDRGRVTITNVTSAGSIKVTATLGNAKVSATFTVSTKGVLSDASEVGAGEISIGAVTSAVSFTGPDVAIGATEVTIIETPSFLVGDDKYGKGIVTVSFTHDSSEQVDTWCRVRTYADFGDGYQEIIPEKRQGVKTGNGNTYWSISTSYSFSISGTTPVRLKITSQGMQIGGGGNTSGSYARSPQIAIFKAQR